MSVKLLKQSRNPSTAMEDTLNEINVQELSYDWNGVKHLNEIGSPLIDFVQPFIFIENNQSIESAILQTSLIVTDRTQDVVDDEEVQRLYDEIIVNNDKNHDSADRNVDEDPLKEKLASAVQNFMKALIEFQSTGTESLLSKKMDDFIVQLDTQFPTA